MDIIIKNCNSIDEAKISIIENKLNIKYGMNGTGKSTIAKAIGLNCTSPVDLSSLQPFKLRGQIKKAQIYPSIAGTESIKSVKIFNDDYIEQFLFKQTEVMQNSFEIFIKNKDYEKRMEEIEKLIIEVRETFKKNSALETVIRDLNSLCECFGKSEKGFTKVSRIAKAVSKENKIENIPSGLEPYSEFIKSETNVGWIKWQIEGNKFLDISTNCPYCTSPTDNNRERILSVEKQYDAKAVEHLNALQEIFDKLRNYFSEVAIENIQTILKKKADLLPEQEQFFNNLRGEAEALRGRLSELKSISYFSFEEKEKVIEKIERLKINMNMFTALNSESTTSIVNELNHCLDSVILKAGLLQGEIALQRNSIKQTITKYKCEINDFLKFAGYKYSVDMIKDGDSIKMILRHEDSVEALENIGSYLSFGESNAFSLVLFMYESLSQNPDIIILDDPISSFDRAKKFAIIEMLFRRKGNFRGRTVLMLTHDIEPIIDIVRNFSDRFAEFSTAHFLRTSLGKIEEIEIKRSDIISFTQVCNQNIDNQKEDIIKLIYLRRYQEILDNKSLAYQMLSSLFHKKLIPDIKKQDEEMNIPMTQEQIENALATIKEKIEGFDYFSLQKQLENTDEMIRIYKNTNNNYEKLQLFRLIQNDNHENEVLRKFVNETFHIENESIMQLNPHKYDFIPAYIISECDKVLSIVTP